MKILITAGGTKVPLDAIRYIGNHSTGRTGAELADHFTLAGFEVDLLIAENSIKPQYLKNYTLFSSFEDLENAMKTKLQSQSYQWVIHLAAVSDFTVNASLEKLDSSTEHTLKLIPTKKLVNYIKIWQPQTKLIAFKLTHQLNESEIVNKVNKLMNQSKADFIVQNNWTEVQGANHKFNVWNHKREIQLNGESKNQLFTTIKNIIQESL